QTSQSPSFCESVTLECQISGHPQPTVTWYREDYKIESSMDFQITFKAGLARLVIREAFAEDSGRFTCTATNKAGSVSTSYLYDKEKQQKPFFKKKLTSLRLKQFGPAHFECRLTPIGDPTMVVEWLHDGKPLEAANRLRMINEFGYCSLDYGVAYSRDSGVITCRATNKYGTDHTSATLIVKDEKSLVEESQLPEGKRGLQRIEELERMAHEGALPAVHHSLSYPTTTTTTKTKQTNPQLTNQPINQITNQPTRQIKPQKPNIFSWML
uniref:Ig-like domain-containing protein n=1 Tax=Cyanistes caeruleus TaxID=156563 RepID=A0A8C0VUF5_CYACU